MRINELRAKPIAMVRIVFLLLVSILANSLLAQRSVEYAGQDFFALRDRLRAHYDSLENIADTLAFREGGDFAQFHDWDLFWSHRLKSGDTYEDYFRAYAASLDGNHLRSGGGNDGDWHEIGPFDLPSGTARIGQKMGYGTGPIRFLTINPNEPEHMLCGSNSGGVYYSENSGDSWRNGGSDSWATSGSHYAVFNSEDPGTWYATTDGFFGWHGAIMRTTDFGATWESIADQADLSEGGIWTEVLKLLPDQDDSDVLFAATGHRLYRCANLNDPNPVWAVLPINVPPTITGDAVYGSYSFGDVRRIYDLEMDPDDHNTLFAAVRFEGRGTDYDNDNVYYWRLMRTFDAGATWSEMPNAPTHAFTLGPNKDWDRNANNMTIEVTEADPSLLYVLYDRPTASDELWKITNTTTGVWTQVAGSYSVTYGGGHGFGVSQTQAGDVFLAKSDRYQTYVSGSWTSYSSSSANVLEYHVDVEDLVGHPANDDEVWMADHGGMHRSTDNGITWQWKGVGLSVAEVYRMSTSYSEPEYVALGLYHDGNLISDGEYGSEWIPDWKQMGGADGHKPLIDPIDGSHVFISSQNNCWRRSVDHGEGCSTLPGTLQPCSDQSTACPLLNPGSGDWDTEGTIDRQQPNIVYISAWYNGFSNPEEVMRSMDRGVSFERVSDFQTLIGNTGANIWRLYPAWPDPNYLYAHVSSGQRLFRTTIARSSASAVQSSWEELELPRSDDVFVADIDFDFEDPDILYISYSSSSLDLAIGIGTEMVFRADYSDPLAPVFVDLTGTAPNGLPNTGVGSEAFSLERGSNGGMYAATDIGVYYTNNEFLSNGDGWQMLGTNLPHTRSRGLEINYKVNKIRVGLYGRGLWERDLWCPTVDNRTENGVYSTDEFIEVNNEITSTAIVPDGTNITYRAGDAVHMLPGFHAVAGSRFHAFIHPCDQEGNSFKSLVPSGGAVEQVDQDDVRRAGSPDDVVLFPNPSAGSFSLVVNDGMSIMEVQVHDQMGRSVRVSVIRQSDRTQCLLAGSPASGIYFVQVRLMNDDVRTIKLSIEP